MSDIGEEVRNALDRRDEKIKRLETEWDRLRERLAARIDVDDWISVQEQKPNKSDPVVYARPKSGGGWSVGIAYWIVSDKWNPEMESQQAPDGFTHWKPLGNPPRQALKESEG